MSIHRYKMIKIKVPGLILRQTYSSSQGQTLFFYFFLTFVKLHYLSKSFQPSYEVGIIIASHFIQGNTGFFYSAT